MIIRKVKQNLINIPGWRTSRKIIVFESDDWGSIRMRSKHDYDFFLAEGYDVANCVYNKYDSLESNTDLEELFKVLSKYKGINQNHPIFTFNNVVANPDFKKIKENNYENFYFESFIESLKKYPNHDKVYELYQEGLSNKLIQTQFHCREHLNISNWMKALQDKRKETLSAFNRGMFTVQYKGNSGGSNNYLDTFGSGNITDIKQYFEIVTDGLHLFKEIWGFNSNSFIAPTYVWPTEIEEVLYKLGVKYIQGTHVQKVPKANHSSGFTRKYHYLGQRNKLNQIYLVRNCFFEPSSDSNYNWVNSCMMDISRSFKWKKPAIIGTHRVNFIGGIRPENRIENLKLLDQLIMNILKKFPDVEFMSSDQLGRLIERN